MLQLNTINDKARVLVLGTLSLWDQSELSRVPIALLWGVCHQIQNVREDATIWEAILGHLDAGPILFHLGCIKVEQFYVDK